MKESLVKQLPTINQIKKELAERSLSEYIKNAWHILEPNTNYMENWHIEAIAEHLQAVELGQIKRLLINQPPRSLKSITGTVMYPTWAWIKNPYRRFISLSYADSLSRKHNMNRRDIIKSPWYQSQWGDKFTLKDDIDRQNRFGNDKQGFMYSTSIGGTLTGEGGDVIIVDDPHNPKRAESDAERNSALEFFRATLPSRLNNQKTGVIIVIMQRLHEEDISGHILANDLGYTHLCLPATAEEKQIISFPISGRQVIREEGDILHPGREGEKELAQLKRDMGTYSYEGQYQQNPSPPSGGMFKKQWWRYWQLPGQDLPAVTLRDEEGNYINIEPVELPKEFDEQTQSWDCAFKGLETSDFVVGQAWGKKAADNYLLDQMKDKMTFIETLSAIRSFSVKWPKTNRKLIEDKANGSAVINVLQKEIPGLIPINPDGGKEVRANAVSPQIESGNVYLPHPMIYDWVDDYIDSFAKFPKAKHDDEVDSTTQYLNDVSSRPGIFIGRA